MGRKVICYFSAGSYENWRPDRHDFPSDVLGNNLEHWEGEKWLDIRDDGYFCHNKAMKVHDNAIAAYCF